MLWKALFTEEFNFLLHITGQVAINRFLLAVLISESVCNVWIPQTVTSFLRLWMTL